MNTYKVFFRCFLITTLFFIYNEDSFCQKKILNSVEYNEWPYLVNPYLNSAGAYLKYEINYGESGRKTTIVKSLSNDWSRRFENVDLQFTNEDNTIFYSSDSILCLSWLGRNEDVRLLVSSYYIPKSFNNDVVFFQQRDSRDLTCINLKSRKKMKYFDVGSVKDYLMSNTGRSLLLKVGGTTSRFETIKIVDFETNKVITVIDSVEAIKYLYDLLENKFAVLVADTLLHNRVFTFDINSQKLNWIDSTCVNQTDSIIRDILTYDARRQTVDVVLQPLAIDNDLKQNIYKANVKIWGYKDIGLPSNFKGFDDNSVVYELSESNGKIVPKNSDKELSYIKRIAFSSPKGRYLVYREGNKFYSYDSRSGIRRCISDNINLNLFSKSDGDYDVFWNYPKILAWSVDGNEIFINDEFDVWRISLSNSFAPKNITNGIGRKNGIMFSLVYDRYGNGLPIIDPDKKIIFTALDLSTKRNGFYWRKSIDDDKSFELLSMDDAMYWVQFTPPSYLKIIYSTEFMPQRARNKNVYLVARSTATSSTNFFITSDFKKFVSVTNNYPERDFNWLTADLMHWKTGTGKELEGILYKPENFDSTKKYPIIFYSYRKSANNLNSFLLPKECPGCIIDIPSYVSSGYLVFTPDIFFTKGQPGKDALTAIVSAADMLSRYPFIDKSRMGIQGCSFSGFTTNYIVTHTNIFAAACSASGLYDFISAYNSITTGIVKQSQFENGPYQIGGTLWDYPEDYIENSAIFNAHRLMTPFLMMGTTLDPTVPFNNSVEFFLAAKRLNKKVWLLQYDNQYHTVFGNEGRDFNIRMRQFFDHYLKGLLPAKWMTSTRNYNRINIGDNLSTDFDSSGALP